MAAGGQLVENRQKRSLVHKTGYIYVHTYSLLAELARRDISNVMNF